MAYTNFLDSLQSFLDFVKDETQRRAFELEADRQSGAWNQTNVDDKLRSLSALDDWEEFAVSYVYYELASVFELALKEAALPAYESKVEALWEKYRREAPFEGGSFFDSAFDKWLLAGPTPLFPNIAARRLKAVVELVESYYGLSLDQISCFDLMAEIRNEVNDWKHGVSRFDRNLSEPPRRLSFDDGRFAIEAGRRFMSALNEATMYDEQAGDAV